MPGGAASSIGALPETAFKGAARERLSRNHRSSAWYSPGWNRSLTPRMSAIKEATSNQVMKGNVPRSFERAFTSAVRSPQPSRIELA
jgi:hypothetical protein